MNGGEKMKPEHKVLFGAVLVIVAVVAYRTVRPAVPTKVVRPKTASPYGLPANN